MIPVKLPTTYKDQITKLRSRGCIIDNESEAIQILSKINYYRLTAYFLPFRKSDGSYNPGTNFNTVYNIYEFDRKMRHIIFSAIEEIEVFIRSTFAYHHAHTFNALGYLDHNNYNQKHKHTEFMAQINNEIKRQNKEPFVKHHNSKYGGQFPIWAIIELFSFRTLSLFYSDMPINSQKILAKIFYKCHYTALSNWLYSCTLLRNICAHFGRLYYRKFIVIPKDIPDLDKTNNRSFFGAVMVLKNLFPDTKKWNNEVLASIKNFITEYKNDIQLKHIGFPDDWESKLKR